MDRRVHELEQRLAELTAENELLQARDQLNRETDCILEEALRDHLPLALTLARLLPLLCRITGAASARLQTLDEDLVMRDFEHAARPEEAKELDLNTAVSREQGAAPPCELVTDQHTLLSVPLDVAGEPFGAAAVGFARPLDAQERRRARDLLSTWCEALDNYLAGIACARLKHRAVGEISAALRDPVLDQGVDRALAVLAQYVAYEDLVLVYLHEEEAEGPTFGYRVIKGGRLLHASVGERDAALDAFMREHARTAIRGDIHRLTERFGVTRHREEALIYGVKSSRVIGRVVAASSKGEFNTFDRDLLERFCDYLCQRIVDFNREWRYLSHSFSRGVVRRMLCQEDYRERYLRPQEHDVAVMFCDISGFTRISEQLLRTPADIGELIDTWGAGAVDIIWETGGVFDKMVGDCVIGLWGPPFFEMTAHEACEAAAAAAQRIDAFTRAMGRERRFTAAGWPEDALGVAIGLNYCPLFVGLFGPNDDYTGFSSGMNNTARLQGAAHQGEILCMDTFVRAIGEMSRFGARRAEQVKNVSMPLVCYPLLQPASPMAGLQRGGQS